MDGCWQSHPGVGAGDGQVTGKETTSVQWFMWSGTGAAGVGRGQESLLLDLLLDSGLRCVSLGHQTEEEDFS